MCFLQTFDLSVNQAGQAQHLGLTDPNCCELGITDPTGPDKTQLDLARTSSNQLEMTNQAMVANRESSRNNRNSRNCKRKITNAGRCERMLKKQKVLKTAGKP